VEKNNDIPYELQFIIKKKPFLFYDSGIDDTNRIVIFTTKENILHFIYSKVIICDATFKSATTNFEQLFTIHCNVKNDNLPLIFCFIKSKNEPSYKFFLLVGKGV
jgi:hypothetical protein